MLRLTDAERETLSDQAKAMAVSESTLIREALSAFFAPAPKVPLHRIDVIAAPHPLRDVAFVYVCQLRERDRLRRLNQIAGPARVIEQLQRDHLRLVEIPLLRRLPVCASVDPKIRLPDRRCRRAREIHTVQNFDRVSVYKLTHAIEFVKTL
jgi:hypothetical protein